MASITVPANFGLEYLELASNDVTLQLSDHGSLQANAVVLCLNSPVIKKYLINQSRALKEPDPNNAEVENELEPGRSSLTLHFQGLDKPAVKVFLKACYSGKLETANRNNLAQIHKMAHKFQVFWITQAVFDDYKNRVKRCVEFYDYDNAHLLFKEAIRTLVVMKKRNFVNVFIQEFSSDPNTRKEFLSLHMKNMHRYSAQELKVAVELSGSRVDIVVNALANHIYEFRRFDDNARSLLYNVNFLYIKKRYPDAHSIVSKALCEHMYTFERKDLESIMKLLFCHGEPAIASNESWNKNIQLPNLFRTLAHKDDVSDELGYELSQKIDVKTDQKSTLPNSSSNSSSSKYVDTFDNRPSDSADSEHTTITMGSENQDDVSDEMMELTHTTSLSSSSGSEYFDTFDNRSSNSADSEGTMTEGSENQDSSDDGSMDSSSSESENMSRFKERMYELRGMEQVSNLYMFIEGLYEWIKLEGDVKLGINFSEAMVFVNNIRIDRGWLPISSEFLNRLANLDKNQDIINLIEALKGTASLISDLDNFLIELSPCQPKYCIKTILQGKNDAKIAFHFKHPRYEECMKRGFCGFLFKLEKGTSVGDFRMELCHAESDYQDESLNLHFHDNLVFAQRMHVTLTGYINGTYSFPLSWEGKPVLDDSGRIVRWGRHKFSKEDGDKSSSRNEMYNWQESKEAMFTVYYCTA